MKLQCVRAAFAVALLFTSDAARATPQNSAPRLDPVGATHIPIGIPNSLDSLKTFVEAEGNFSPGIGSYGLYFWVFDPERKQLVAPTAKEVGCKHGLAGERYLIPWAEWQVGKVGVRTEVCEVRRDHDRGESYLVGARAHLSNCSDKPRRVSLYVALRPVGPAGFDVPHLAVSNEDDALLANEHPAVIADVQPAAAGVLPTDTISQSALRGDMPTAQVASSQDGNCSGALRFDLSIPIGQSKTIGLVCPVHAGRRAVRHAWEARTHNYVDVAVPQSGANGIDIPDAGLDYYRAIAVDELFQQSQDEWSRFYGRVALELPDQRWTNGFYVMLAHAGLCMNEGAADVAVLNYTVFNRDGMYIANMMQKAALPGLSRAVIDYFLERPFNGRPFPEADNPGQVLWSIGQHWRFTGDRQWLRQIYPSARKLSDMIRYCRTTPRPHWVNLRSLECGDALTAEQRMELEPGRCDGFHPEYTEAFDIVGLRVASELAEAMGQAQHAQQQRALADRLLVEYGERFEKELAKDYGSYSVLWPCRLYALSHGRAHEQFNTIGRQGLAAWRYFAPATAHQGLLAGNRQAGYGTVDSHLEHPQMQGWFAFDEGGKSGSGGWHHLRTTWKHSKTQPDRNHAVAMPHGWAIAEVWLLMRDCLVFEQGDQLVLLAGVSPDWLTDPKGIAIERLPTYFGDLDLSWKITKTGAELKLAGSQPPDGFILRLPSSLPLCPMVAGKPVKADANGDYLLPAGTSTLQITLEGVE